MTKIKDLFEDSTTKAVEEIKDSSIQDLSTLCNKLLRVEGMVGNVEERLKRLKEQQRELSEQIIPDKLSHLGEDAIAKELGELLISKGHIPDEKEAVHSSTLRAFVKEQIESGNGAFDLDVQKKFSVYQGKRTKINR